MKKYAVYLIFMICAINVRGQFNIHGGIIRTNSLHAPSKNAGTFEGFSGFCIGGDFQKKINKKWNTETGIFYNQKGYSYFSVPTPDNTFSRYYRVNYFTLDQHFIYRIFTSERLLLSGRLGPFIAKGISGNYTEDATTIAGPQHYERKIKFGKTASDDVQSWDAGFNFLLRLGYRKFHITGILGQSLTSHTPVDKRQTYKERFQSISLLLGYKF